MTITTDMSNYEIEFDSAEVDYDDEILCAGWVPDVGLAYPELHAPHGGLSTDIAEDIPDLFLQKMYSYQE